MLPFQFNRPTPIFPHFSLFADFANVFAYLVVFWFDFEHASHISMHPKEMDLKGLPFFTGVAIYCYEGAGMILSLEASIAKDYRSRFKVRSRFFMCVNRSPPGHVIGF